MRVCVGGGGGGKHLEHVFSFHIQGFNSSAGTGRGSKSAKTVRSSGSTRPQVASHKKILAPQKGLRSAGENLLLYSPPTTPCLTVVGLDRGAGTSSTQMVVRARE